jgi:hypothetical protein
MSTRNSIKSISTSKQSPHDIKRPELAKGKSLNLKAVNSSNKSPGQSPKTIHDIPDPATNFILKRAAQLLQNQ